MDDLKNTAVSGVKRTWCTLWNFTVNTARRAQILGRYGQACAQQQKIKEAERHLGEKSFQALERGEANPLTAPEVNEAVQKVKEAKERKEKTYQAIAAIREKIRSSCVIPTPEEPGGVEENPPVP
jgi:uncharacterized protein YifE (UPF0438 family)